MRLGLINSAWVQAGRGTAFGIRMTKEIGFDAIDVFVDTMERFLEEVNHPAVKANIDISHLQLAGVAPAELRRLQGQAIHVHISDCDGKVHGDLPPGRGVVDFGPYLREIKHLNIDGAVSIELEYSPEPDKIAEWVKEAYTATDRLMKQANLRG